MERRKSGSSEFATEQFALDQELPTLTTLALDKKRKPLQLMLETVEAGSCVFHVLAYAHTRIVPLLSVDTGSDCKPPEARGSGVLAVPSWEGFWWKWTRYRLDAEGLALQPQLESSYPVQVRVTAGKPLKLGGAACPEQTVAAGSVVELERYDVRRHSYFARRGQAACGWLPAATLSDPEAFTDVPWAG